MSTAHLPTSPSGKKQRSCPAVQGFISSAECGAQRGSKAELELGTEPKAAISSEVSEVLDKAFAGPHRHRIEMDASREFGTAPEVAFSTPADAPDPNLSQQGMIERMLQRQYRAMLDDHIPALDGHTPRECARDPARRAVLMEWMKGHLHQIEANNRRDSTHFSIDWVVDELGLAELK